MSPEQGRKSSPPQRTEPASKPRSGFVWAIVTFFGIGLALAIWHARRDASAPPTATGAPSTAAPHSQGLGVPPPKPLEPTAEAVAAQLAPPPIKPTTQASGTARSTITPSTAVIGPVDPAVAALVGGLKSFNDSNTALTAETVEAWQTNFAKLVQAGPAAIPAILAFLAEKGDTPFSREVWQALGYSSARIAVLDALRQIGGPEGIAAMERLLATSASPKEIAVLARHLEESAPGQYREKALAAARSGLLATATPSDRPVDVAPFFEVFSHYGDAALVPELEKAVGQWKYYATIALANLPDGAGLPSLLKMADPSTASGNRVVALEMIAQMAGDNAAAREYLINQAKNNSIPANLWPYLISPLSGDQYFPVDSAITPYPQVQSWADIKTTHINYGNQNLYTLPGHVNLTPEGIDQRLALVAELLKAISDPAALQTLQQAQATLARRATRPVVQPPSATANPDRDDRP